jgi:hypothetical protein
MKVPRYEDSAAGAFCLVEFIDDVVTGVVGDLFQRKTATQKIQEEFGQFGSLSRIELWEFKGTKFVLRASFSREDIIERKRVITKTEIPL